jgi:hypothetical protein
MLEFYYSNQALIYSATKMNDYFGLKNIFERKSFLFERQHHNIKKERLFVKNNRSFL